LVRVGRTQRIQSDADVTRFLAIADDLPDVAWRSGPDPRDRVFNERWFELTGMRRWDCIGTGWLDAMHPDDRERCEAVHERFARARGSYQIDYRVVIPGGEYRQVRERAMPVRRNAYAYIGTCVALDG
jgi:PAS domain S-box-containing protein